MGNCLCQPSASPSSTLPPPSVPSAPSVSPPSVPSAPSVSLPSVSLPSVSLPSVSLPSVSLPSLDVDEKTRERVPSASDWYQGITYENTPEYTLEGLHRKVKILRVIDGDTVDIALHHEETGRIYRHRVRLYGIDTPEKRPSRSDPQRDLEIAASFQSKQALEQRLLENDYIVLAVFHSPDKYGRLLCSFYDKHGENVNEWMVKKGHATEYFGKTKKKFQAVSFTPRVSI